MPSSDYTSAGGGLKLKGAKPTGIEKKRKKKSSSKFTAVTTTAASSKDATPAKDDTADPETTTDLEQREKNKEESLIPDDGKTEYERRHEETRRKRVSLNATEVVGRYTEETTARGKIDARGCQDTQGTCRGIEQVLVDTQRAPRHASHRSWITRFPALLASHASLSASVSRPRYDLCASLSSRFCQRSISPRSYAYTSCDSPESARRHTHRYESRTSLVPFGELRRPEPIHHSSEVKRDGTYMGDSMVLPRSDMLILRIRKLWWFPSHRCMQPLNLVRARMLHLP
jgi:protein FAM32A